MAATSLSSSAHGLWVPAILLFFHYGRGLSVAGAGTAMTVGGVVSLVTASPAAGVILDRIGPFRTKAWASLLLAAAFAGFEVTHNLVEVAVFCGLGDSSNALFFGSDIEAVRRVADSDGERDKVFANLMVQRVVGFGAGAGIGGLALAWSDHTAVVWDVLVLSLLFINVVAAVWFWSLRTVDDRWREAWDAAAEPLQLPGYREALRDCWFLALVGATALIAVSVLGLDDALPIYLVESGLPAWSVTTVYVVVCLLSVGLLRTVPRLVKRFRRAELMAASSLIGAVGYLAFWAAGMIHGSVIAVIITLSSAAVLHSVSSSFSNTLPNVSAYAFAPEHTSGRHSILMSSGWSLAGVLCPMLYTGLVEWHHAAPWIFSSILSTVAATLFYALRWHRSV